MSSYRKNRGKYYCSYQKKKKRNPLLLSPLTREAPEKSREFVFWLDFKEHVSVSAFVCLSKLLRTHVELPGLVNVIIYYSLYWKENLWHVIYFWTTNLLLRAFVCWLQFRPHPSMERPLTCVCLFVCLNYLLRMSLATLVFSQ